MAEVAVLVGGVATAIATLVAAFRTRKDVDYKEQDRRIASLAERINSLESETVDQRRQLVECRAENFRLRMLLADHGISGVEQS